MTNTNKIQPTAMSHSYRADNRNLAYNHRSEHTEVRLRAVMNGLEVMVEETRYYENGKSRTALVYATIPPHLLNEIIKVVAAANDISNEGDSIINRQRWEKETNYKATNA